MNSSPLHFAWRFRWRENEHYCKRLYQMIFQRIEWPARYLEQNPCGAKKLQKIVLELLGVNYTRAASATYWKSGPLPALLGPGVESGVHKAPEFCCHRWIAAFNAR
jgi:hypothetical protein